MQEYGVHDFKEVAKIAKKTKCRIKIKSKKGMPFVFNRYKKRKIFAILLICIFVSIIVFSNFIWNIEVTGTEKINRINKLLEMPEEISSNEPKITIMGFNQMLIENYKGILEYQEFFIRINTYTGIININGFQMSLNEMTGDDIMVTGKIDSVDFESMQDEEE